MIFYLHYILLTSGLSGASVLLGVFLKLYSDASQGEIGVLLMSFPFVAIIIKPLFCSMADRSQAHKIYLVLALIIMCIGWSPFVIVPYFPQFYQPHPRASWYLFVFACHIGNGGLGVAWSLGDSLAVNMSQKNKTPFSRMRLMGTVSWGLYGFIIGQINESPYFPKFVPAFLILQISVIVEIALIMCWNNEDFIMYDSSSSGTLERQNEQNSTKMVNNQHNQKDTQNIDSAPSSLSGTLRLNSRTAATLKDIFASEDLSKELRKIERSQEKEMASGLKKIELANFTHQTTYQSKQSDFEKNSVTKTPEKKSNLQVLIFKMILTEDGRLIKYLILFTMFGVLLAPMNFVFLSLEEVCKTKDCNFSQLVGAVLISQATIETLSFLVVPWFLTKVSRSVALAFGLIILFVRYFFYANYFYTSDISPYWALVGEWGHGIAFGIFCTILADIALMFANQSRLFIPELKEMGFVSNDESENKEKVQADENSIKMALRATMQAVFGGVMDGLGNGVGSLICGVVAEAYSYITLWQLFAIMALSTGLIHQLVEVTRSRCSDTYFPKLGTKAFEIMSMSCKESKIESEKPPKIEIATKTVEATC